jgi:UDP-N-acetyl-alpha-D-muramoyl-L-alanyl-L-glutamate epimerase
MGRFDPTAQTTFRFTARSLEPDGTLRLHYALDDAHEFVEELRLPMPAHSALDLDSLGPLLDLVHWVAGVSYYKTAAPPRVACETGAPPPAVAAYLEALYSEGLGEFAVVNNLPHVPRPRFPSEPSRGTLARASANGRVLSSVLVPIGGGKDSIVALEIVRRAGLEATLFSVRDDASMARTAAVAGLPRLVVQRTLPLDTLRELHDAGALNGHVPITAIIACVALLTAALHGHDAVVLANERSASAANVTYDGMEINHQFSKSARAEELLRAAVAQSAPQLDVFSVLRPASELAIAQRFAALTDYHRAFTSCNTIFRLDPALRGASWCANCPKCRFVFLILAPFMEPDALRAIIGSPMLDDPAQFDGFALLTATGGHKPFECVGEEEESLAAIALLAGDPRWRDRPVVRRLADELLAGDGGDRGRIERVLRLSGEHHVPERLMGEVRALLGA